MVFKLYGYPLSSPVKLVATLCFEKNVHFEFVSLDLLKGENKSAEHLARNPWGKVPVIDDDGFILYESRAIVRYIAEKYSAQGPQLIPTDVQKRALLEQAISNEAFNWDKLVDPILFETIYKKYLGGETDPVKLEQLTNSLGKNLDVFEKILSKQKYIAGDELTIADFYFLPGGSSLAIGGVTMIQDRPNLKRWFNEISSRPSWQKAQTALQA
ncbi:Glutathione S-transferase F12 [Leucoagaricus sp. SymC.cos]|nr:Glutathione S-transferase F12 [Leucoagaricus sp. SymC.cos]